MLILFSGLVGLQLLTLEQIVELHNMVLQSVQQPSETRAVSAASSLKQVEGIKEVGTPVHGTSGVVETSEGQWREQPQRPERSFKAFQTDSEHPQQQQDTTFMNEQKQEQLNQLLHKMSPKLPAASAVAFNSSKPFRIFCTTKSRHLLTYGSYKLRCKMLRYYMQRYFGDSVLVHAAGHTKAAGPYHATISIKSVLLGRDKRELPRETYGTVFIDIVDEYSILDSEIPESYHVIVQNKAHANVFVNHEAHIVEHWYNSFPADVGKRIHFPGVFKKPVLKVLTLWSGKTRCPSVGDIQGVQYDCLHEEYDIKKWYTKYLNSSTILPDALERIDKSWIDPELGPGYVYQQLFRQYDLLVVPAKTNETLKDKYGSTQRVTSQMRSGVPVLVQRYGPALSEFIDTYGYPCTFGKSDVPEADAFFQAMLELVKSVDARRQCQKLAGPITSDYSPERIIQNLLEALGYYNYSHFH